MVGSAEGRCETVVDTMLNADELERYTRHIVQADRRFRATPRFGIAREFIRERRWALVETVQGSDPLDARSMQRNNIHRGHLKSPRSAARSGMF